MNRIREDVREDGGSGWSIAIVSSRETVDVLRKNILGVLNGIGQKSATIDLIINGNTQLAGQAGAVIERLLTAASANVVIRVWNIETGDKANAWNQYIHQVWPQSEITFFLDGYVQIAPDSMTRLFDALQSNQYAQAATGVPSVGSSSTSLRKKMLQQGGLHGNFHAIRGSFIERIREHGFRLPLGLYRTDSLIGAIINFNLDPAHHSWDPRRIMVVPGATWVFKPLDWKNLRDLRSHWSRMMRQAQGHLENQAYREHLAFQKRAPKDLAESATDLVDAWIANRPWDAVKLFAKNPLSLVALNKLRRHQRFSPRSNIPLLMGEIKFQENHRSHVGQS